MNSQLTTRGPRSKIAIAGAGPAGSSLAIRLADAGFDVVLIERKRFPRQKLCGEFISPECLRHFHDLHVADQMLDAGGDRILETRFFELGGRGVTVPTGWFGSGDFALSLSRAEMDNLLLKQARRAGVDILEGVSIVGIERENGRLAALKARSEDGESREIAADIFVDATGRASVIRKLVEKENGHAARSSKPDLVGFKAHVRDAAIPKGVCEIYSFPGGYAGLSNVENDLANLCFLIKSDVVRSAGGDADELVKTVVSKNKRAVESLARVSAASEWLAVSVDGFGTKPPSPAANLFSVGDAASFIDPFTGSGMVMAFESSEILAETFAGTTLDLAGRKYADDYRKRFANRLRVCSLLRRTAFMPRLATTVVATLRISTAARRTLARATRG